MKRLLLIFLVLLALAPAIALSALTEPDKAVLTDKNLLINPGWENGRYPGWTASAGTYAHVTAAANKRSGNGSASWDASAASQTLTASAITITSGGGMSGANGEASCYIKAASGTATHTIQAYDGTNVLASVTISSSTSGFVRSSVLFPFPASGSVYLRLVSAADEPVIYLDDCYLGPPTRIMDVNAIGPWQSETITSTLTGNASNTAYTRRVGDTLEVQLTQAFSGATTSSNFNVSLPSGLTIDTAKMSSGSNDRAPIGWINVHDSSAGKNYVGFLRYGTTSTLLGYWMDPTSAATDFGTRLSDTSPVTIASGDRIDVYYRVPISGWVAETGFRPEEMGGSWSGYHQQDCSWALTSASYTDFTADAACTFTESTNMNFGTVTTAGSSLPGIIFTPKRAGRYLVVASVPTHATSATQTFQLRMTDGTNTLNESECYSSGNTRCMVTLAGIVNASSTSAVTIKIQGSTPSGALNINCSTCNRAANWSILALDQQVTAPLLVNSVTTSYAGHARTEAAEINCDASSAITSQLGSISSVGNRSTTSCALTLVTGAYSAAPYTCQVTPKSATVQATSCSCSSATSCTIYGANADYDAYVFLMGPR